METASSFFFFSSRRRHTRLQGDWSSDVCSSDLRLPSERALKSATRSAQIPRYVGLSMLHPVNTEPSSHRSAAPTLNLDDGATAISMAARALVSSSALSIVSTDG